MVPALGTLHLPRIEICWLSDDVRFERGRPRDGCCVRSLAKQNFTSKADFARYIRRMFVERRYEMSENFLAAAG